MIPSGADRVAMLVNPKAGPTDARPRAERLAALLRREGFAVEIFTELAEAAARANGWHAEGRLRALVGVGGDGTAAELANRTAEGVPLALLPGGNSNLLARYIGMRKKPEVVCRAVAEGLVARLDAGRANGRLFLLMAGCGFDADVVQRVHERRTGHIHLMNYLPPVAQAVCHYGYPEMRIQWADGDSSETFSARWLIAFNLPCYGGGFRIAPEANGADGRLNLCSFRRGRFWPYFLAVLARQHRRLADWNERRATRASITADAPVPYQLDGDPGGWLPLEIESLPGRLALVMPCGHSTIGGVS